MPHSMHSSIHASKIFIHMCKMGISNNAYSIFAKTLVVTSLEISSADSFRSLVEADSSPLLFQSTLRTEFDPGVSLLPSLNSDRSFFVFFFFCLLMELSRPFFFFFVCFSSSMMSTEQRSLLSLSLLRPFLLPFFCLDLACAKVSMLRA